MRSTVERAPTSEETPGYTGHVAMWRNRAPCRQPFLRPPTPCSPAALLAAGVSPDVIRFELFDAGHMGIDYRYPLSLTWLCQRIAR